MAWSATARRVWRLLPATVLAAVALTALAAPARAGILEDARALAARGQRAAALRLLEDRLQTDPADADARVLYGLMLSWDSRYDDARREFEAVLAKHPDYTDAITGLINVELWSKHPERAEQIASRVLDRKGSDTRLLYAKARALRAQNRDREALEAINQLLVADPTNQDALAEERSLRESLQQWKASFTRTFDWFNHGAGSWNESDFDITRGTALGTVGAEFSRADRYGLHSNITELTFYPHLRHGTYAYLGFGYSADGVLFPNYRLGAEIFQSLPAGMEMSAGWRKYGFAQNTNLYTGSLGKYLGNWLLTTRVYLTPDLLGVSHSVSVSARRFLRHPGDYVDFRFGTGASPFDPRSREELASLKALSGYVQWRKSLGLHWMSDLLVGLALEDRLHGVALEHYVLQSTMYYRF
ncbi:MAG: YaiO family outer membrane beta-barrel protein [Acidobacteriota bacterium]|nr:YaiO family outer membrane beta-barrel protein [Acidobacteriota bacterium]